MERPASRAGATRAGEERRGRSVPEGKRGARGRAQAQRSAERCWARLAHETSRERVSGRRLSGLSEPLAASLDFAAASGQATGGKGKPEPEGPSPSFRLNSFAGGRGRLFRSPNEICGRRRRRAATPPRNRRQRKKRETPRDALPASGIPACRGPGSLPHRGRGPGPPREGAPPLARLLPRRHLLVVQPRHELDERHVARRLGRAVLLHLLDEAQIVLVRPGADARPGLLHDLRAARAAAAAEGRGWSVGTPDGERGREWGRRALPASGRAAAAGAACAPSPSSCW